MIKKISYHSDPHVSIRERNLKPHTFSKIYISPDHFHKRYVELKNEKRKNFKKKNSRSVIELNIFL